MENKFTMTTSLSADRLKSPKHSWLRRVHFSRWDGHSTPVLEEAAANLISHLRRSGNCFQSEPDVNTDVLLTTAPFGEPIDWREALLFTARLRTKLSRTPTIFTLIHATTAEFQNLLDHFDRVLAKEPPEPSDFAFPGLAPNAYRTLVEQGRRGGAIMAVERLLQAQSKCIRIILIVGDERPDQAFYFDLVGAHPSVDADDLDFFYRDMALRIVTSASTAEVIQHTVAGDPVPRQVWDGLTTPAAMRAAGIQLGNREFFTQMVRIADLVNVPAMADAVAVQYSEGCFATWDPQLGALIATVTGSARPVEKDSITSDDLAVIVGVRPDGLGALVRHVERKRNDPPSSEAVEMMDMDSMLPRLDARFVAGASEPVPVVRSKLHGHRGVDAYNPKRVEFVPLDAPYYHYPVSCATEAQARAIKSAFARSEALQNPADPRQVVFTVLPGHGVVIAEKWVDGKVPFQTIWEYMDSGDLHIDNLVPQGPMEYAHEADGTRRLAREVPLYTE